MPASLDWLAGVLEGEGTIRIGRATKRNNGSLIVSMVNTDREMVDAFADRWPTSSRSIRIKKKADRRKQAYYWAVSSRMAAEILTELAPYIVTARVQRKVMLALAYQAQKTRNRSVNRSPEYRATQTRYFEKMRELNERGDHGQV